MTDASDTLEAETVPAIRLISEVQQNFDCQPVLFIGAGFARRYIQAPDWDGALKEAAKVLGKEAPDYNYLLQRFNRDRIEIGTFIGNLIFDWAWKSGRRIFPEELFKSNDKYIFLKHLVSQELADSLKNLDLLDDLKRAEIEALIAIRPHSVITTNYDRLCETVLHGYDPVVGSSVLRYNLNAFGEIYHIHGIADDPESMVLTRPDYDAWNVKSRYFAAKLLTYFAEHPVFIFGYGIGDPNVKTILSDIGRITADETGLINNVIQIVYDPRVTEPKVGQFAVESEGCQFRLSTITTDSLLTILKQLAARHELGNVNPALVRTLAARVMKLTRKDIPAGKVEVDYGTLERFANDDNELPKLLGLTIADDSNKHHPYTLSMVADKLGLASWQHADKLIKRVKKDHGYDLRGGDNRYHCRIRTGKKDASAVRKWSDEAVSLLCKVRDGVDYKLHV